MSLRRLSSEAINGIHKNVTEHQLARVVTLIGRSYVSWASALCIVGVATAFVCYEHDTQLESFKETMATKMEVADVKVQVAEVKGLVAVLKGQVAEVKGQMIVQSNDIAILKGGVEEILKRLDAKSK